MEKELYRFNPWWEDDFESLEILQEREESFAALLPNIGNRQVVFLTGLRRVVKPA